MTHECQADSFRVADLPHVYGGPVASGRPQLEMMKLKLKERKERPQLEQQTKDARYTGKK